MLDPDLPGLAGSFLGDLDQEALTRLLEGAKIVDVPRGRRIFDEPPVPRAGVILEGTARTYLVGDDRRELTLRYVRPPGMITTASTSIAVDPVPISLQAVSNVSVLEIDVGTLRELVNSNTRAGLSLANELSRRLTDVYRSFGATFFGTLRERLATHLLHSAEPTAAGLTAPITQLGLAEALGTAREVVGRALQQLQREGCIAVGRGEVLILDPQTLVHIAGSWWVPSRLFSVDASRGADVSFDRLAQPVIGIDNAGDIIYANAAVTPTFGWPARELIGRPATVLLPTPVAEGFLDRLAAFMANPSPRPIGFGSSVRGRRADGTEFPAEVTVMPMRRGRAVASFATVVDVSYRRVLRERLERRQPDEPAGASSRREPAGAVPS